MTPLPVPARLLILTGLVALTLAGSVALGSADASAGEVLRALVGDGDPRLRLIVIELRLPRACLAALVGAGLALSGAVFQALLRNPLAEPYVLGVSGGAAVGAVMAIVFGWSAETAFALPLAAFVGALGAIALVLRIALSVGRSLDPRVLILAGVVVAAFFNAVILLLLNIADVESFRSAVFWMMGRLSGASWHSVALLALYTVPALVVLLAMSRALNLMALGDDTAHFLGTRVGRLKLVAYVTTSLLVAAAVAVSGVIGFVGLIVPHGVRLLWGSDHRFLLPACALAGAAFLLATDTLSRIVLAPAELPTGVTTAILGVPLFVFLLVRRGG